MKLKNKILSLLLAVLMVISISGCGSKEETVQAADLSTTAQWLQEKITEPVYGSVGGEWLVLGLARSSFETSEEYFENYYRNVTAVVQEKEGVLDEHKHTEYSRVILALTAIGKDPTDVAGYNLLKPLADYEKTIYQGMNGPVFALLALDCGEYEIPMLEGEGIQATREMYLDYILSNEAPDGGWSFAGGGADVDITAMVLQALAKYQDRQEVADAVERALKFLSEAQNENGGYAAYGAESSESVSQVITALTELGIDMEDSRFVKNGNSLKDNLLTFMTEEGTFLHIHDGEADMMATEQAFYALVSIERMEKGLTSLYDMHANE